MTPSPAKLRARKSTDSFSLNNVASLTRVAVLVAAGLVLFLFESAIPRPLPWLKPGLSNLVVLVALYAFGFRMALVVMLLRVVVGALILGTLFNPVFLFSLAGGIVATSLMAFLYHHFGRIFSIIGVSVSGAFAHNLVQILIAAFLLVGRAQLLYLLPIMLLSSLFSGMIVGLVAHFVLLRMNTLNPAATY